MNKPTFRGTKLAMLIGISFPWALPATAVDWVGPTGDDVWSTATNWSSLAAPGASDDVLFGLVGSGADNVVDRDFTIRSLRYGSNSVHRTRVLPGFVLGVTGPVDIGLGDPGQGAAVTWGGGGQVMVGTAAAATRLWIGVNNSTAGSGTTAGSLALEDISVGGFINDLSVGRKSGPSFVTSGASGSLVLGSNSTLSVGTATARANVFVGYNDTNAGSATGVLDARQGSVDIHALNFSVGAGYGGSGTGTLRWDRPTTLDVTNMYIGRGIGTGVLDLAPGATFLLGSAAQRTSLLGIAYNDSAAGAGTAQAAVDLSINNPSFAAYLADDLSVGRKSGPSFVTSSASGSLVLGSNSTLSVGTATARANVFVGYNDTNAGSATGVLDVRQGSVDIHALNFSVGTSAGAAAAGTVSTGAQTAIDTTNLDVGTGAGANGTFNLSAGVLTATTTNLGPGGQFVFTGGRFNAKTFNGALVQEGGTLAPGPAPARLTIAQGYSLASAGQLEIELSGTAAATQYDQLAVTGAVDLSSDLGLGGRLDLVLAFAPAIGSSFVIIDNDAADAVAGTFRGLAEGSTLAERFGGVDYTFSITYLGGTGNDVVLTAAVPELPTAVLLLAGVVALLGRRHRGRWLGTPP